MFFSLLSLRNGGDVSGAGLECQARPARKSPQPRNTEQGQRSAAPERRGGRRTGLNDTMPYPR